MKTIECESCFDEFRTTDPTRRYCNACLQHTLEEIKKLCEDAKAKMEARQIEVRAHYRELSLQRKTKYE